MDKLRRIDPVFIYALLGLILFLALRDTTEPPEAVGEIQVSRQDILQHIQFRERRFDADWVERFYARLSAEEKQKIIDEYIGEEAMVREARRLGLDTDDFVIRQRLIQKLNFIDIDPEEEKMPDTATLEAWFADQAERYDSAARISFTHIFFANESNQSADDVAALRNRLNEANTPPAQALPFGERFAYLRSYQDRDLADIKSHFGAEFVTSLSQQASQTGRWLGPLVSRWGNHLVYIEAFTPQSRAQFTDVKSKVLYDWRQDQKSRAEQTLARRMAEKYTIRMLDDLK